MSEVNQNVLNHIVKQGTLRRYSTREDKLREKYYVLYNVSEKNASRLDWYDSEKNFKANSTIRKSVFIEEIQRISRYTPADAEAAVYGKRAKFVLKLETYRSPDKPEYLAASSESEAEAWKSCISRLLEAARSQSLRNRTVFVTESPIDDLYQPNNKSCASFDVEVDDTAAANLCNLYGQYRLVLSHSHLTLVDQNNKPAVSWEYCNVRRYGFGADRFTLEGGHKAGAAQGLFIFKNCAGSSIRAVVEKKMSDYQASLRQKQQQRVVPRMVPLPPQQNAGSEPYAYVTAEKFSSNITPPSVDTTYSELSGVPSPQISPLHKTTTGPAVKPKPPSIKPVRSISGGSDTSNPPPPKPLRNSNLSRTSSSGSSTDAGHTTAVRSSSGSSSRLADVDGYYYNQVSPTSSIPDSHHVFDTSNDISHKTPEATNRLQSSKPPLVDAKGKSGRRINDETALVGSEYEVLDVHKNVNARAKPVKNTSSTVVNDDVDYDPTHLYGPIQATSDGSGAFTTIVGESEYAEIGCKI